MIVDPGEVRRAIEVGVRWAHGAGVVPVTGPGRDAERAASNRAAADALAGAPCVPFVLGREPDGRPIWPQGWTGSTTHAAGLAVALACPTSAHRAVGVDLEVDGALPLDDAQSVLAPDEADRIERAGGDATLVWSAKESAFKCWSHAMDGRLPRVDPVEIIVEIASDGSFAARAVGDLQRHLGPLSEVEGRWCRVSELLLTSVVIAPGP